MHHTLLVIDEGRQQQLGGGGGLSPRRKGHCKLVGHQAAANQLHCKTVEVEQPLGVGQLELRPEG